ncbi:hypothetical protein [Rhodothalassium salexigens]|uniref:hypothetical protein n=1 Tax=Rhodothalassium salexigens TaxID=1086 RepID=UPI001911B22B|nr:hypothetical protein [Rhodothalassium salexigens]
MSNPADLPHWPRRMKAHLAAAYMGVAPSTFHSRVRQGRYPSGYRNGGNVLWYKEDLDVALDALKGLVPAEEEWRV